jgi:SAM-dependent methyltransferase
MQDTRGDEYARRLQAKEMARWKQLLNVQAPYRWNLRRQRLGRTLDIGCGIGRNLETLDDGSLGVDHNEASVAAAKARGLDALDLQGWATSPRRAPESFDSLLLAHVVEHMDERSAEQLVRDYLPYLRPGGRVFFICPQERGYATDSTHVRFTDGDALVDLANTVGLVPGNWFSFPFPRFVGKVFPYNEFCLLAHKPTQ